MRALKDEAQVNSTSDCPIYSSAHAQGQKQSRIIKCTALWIQVASYLKAQNKAKK